jgi:hypothetical protein
MPAFKVTEVLSSKPWSKDGEVKQVYWDFRAEGVEKICNIGRKPGNDLKVGESFEATAEEDRGKLKLKTVQQGFRGGGGPRPEDPVRSKRILRQHSQDMAIGVLHLSERLGIEKAFEGVSSVSDVMGMVKKLADAFDRDVEETAGK